MWHRHRDPGAGIVSQGGRRRWPPLSRRDAKSRATAGVFPKVAAAGCGNQPTDPAGNFSYWSVTRLVEHLAKETGIRFSNDQLRRLLRQERFSAQRLRHTMKGKRNER